MLMVVSESAGRTRTVADVARELSLTLTYYGNAAALRVDAGAAHATHRHANRARPGGGRGGRAGRRGGCRTNRAGDRRQAGRTARQRQSEPARGAIRVSVRRLGPQTTQRRGACRGRTAVPSSDAQSVSWKNSSGRWPSMSFSFNTNRRSSAATKRSGAPARRKRCCAGDT